MDRDAQEHRSALGHVGALIFSYARRRGRPLPAPESATPRPVDAGPGPGATVGLIELDNDLREVIASLREDDSPADHRAIADQLERLLPIDTVEKADTVKKALDYFESEVTDD